MRKILFILLVWISQSGYSQSNKIINQLSLPQHSIRNEITLNGIWDFTINQTKEKTQIQVPGCYAHQWDGKWGKPYWDAFAYPREWVNKGALYEKQLVIPKTMSGMNIRLHLNGCLQNYTVLFPGKTFETVHDGYTPKDFDLGKNLSSDNCDLKIRVEDEGTRLNGGESMKSRGIWDDVSLMALPDVFVEEGVVIKTYFQNKAILSDIPVRNLGNVDQKILVKHFITDAKGKVAKTINGGEYSLHAGETKVLHVKSTWNNPHLWFPHDPYLYHLNTVIYTVKGQPIDWHRERFGFREISWKGPKLFINGRELFLRGHGEHYLGDIQASREYFETWFTEFKKLGVNFTRLHIYPRNKVLYEVADEMGFLLEAEPAFHFQVPKDTVFAMKHLGDMMKGLINHPSIITWSVSNEFRWRGGGEKPWLVAHAKSIDNTRPVFSSDFSEFSVAGDIIGHHYNTETVFKEWEQFGPEKPMIWDELGEVWQPNRPLGNGTAGFEVIAQDYATGIYRDGNDEIKKAMDIIREGQSFSGKFHRINAIVPWDLGCVFFRWQPYNRFKGIIPSYATLESPDVKAKQILPCSTPVNIWDPTLPVYEPNPGYYLFDEDLKWVRFPYDSKDFSFFAGEKSVIASPLLIYDDLRLVDEVRCKVETFDGRVLSQIIKKMNIIPGEIVRNIKWDFIIPVLSQITSVKIVREFCYKGETGYRDVREGRIFPKFSSNLITLNNKTLGVIDKEGTLLKSLRSAGINCKVLSGNVKPTDASILLVNSNELPENANELNAAGVCIIQLMLANKILTVGSARLLLNGPEYKVLNGIEQKELTFWKGGNEYGGLKKPDGLVNSRILIAGDRDSKTSALHELYIGSGCRWVTSLKIVENINIEPQAGWLLRNLIQAAADYNPELKSRRVCLFGDADFAEWFSKTGAIYKTIKTLTDKSLTNFDVLILDTRRIVLGDEEGKAISAFTQAGGKVFMYQITDVSISGIKKVIDSKLILTQPFNNENTNCVKAATSWTLRSSPKKGVEYFDSIVIPQPFEPNYNPLLAGMSNIDLNWSGKPMFDHGIKIQDMSQVSLNDHFKILISNWRNDWSVPPFGGEYINEGKDMRQALWFLNRDPVLVSVKQGKGEYLLCQLNLIKGEGKGIFLARHLLTNWNCSIGVKTSFPTKKSIFDFSAASDQIARMGKVEKQIANLKPLAKIPSEFFDMGSGNDGKLRRILLLVDNRMMPVAPEIIKAMNGFGSISYSGVTVESPQVLLNNFENAIGGSKWDVIYFTIGYEGISDFSENGLKSFDKDVQKIVLKLKNTNAKLMWGTQPPLPLILINNLNNAQIEILNNRAKIIMEANGVLINDTYRFMMDKTPEYLNQDRKELTLINSDFFTAFTPKLIKTIVEALKFFGN